MFELAILVALVAAVVIGLRHGKPAAPDMPIIVQQAGQYHITLAPRLDFALAFVETLAQRLARDCHPTGDTPAQCFQVRYQGAASRPAGFYLLAVAFRKGIFFLQAISPLPLLRDTDNHLNTLRAFSGAVLARYPLVNPGDAQDTTGMETVIETVAAEMGAAIGRLAD